MDLTALASAGALILTSLVSLWVAFRIGVQPAQKALIDALNGTIVAQRERIAVLESEVRQLRTERDGERTERMRLERRIAKLERLIVDKFLALSSDQIDRLLDQLGPDCEEPAA
jgi:uncharacterized coiled-coil protein SlyX